MTGASLTTVVDVAPNLNKKLVYFSGTTDASKDLDFSAYSSVDWVSAVVAATLVPEPATAYSAGGDIRFTSISTAIKGVALVNL
jgi:hypothetical protein